MMIINFEHILLSNRTRILDEDSSLLPSTHFLWWISLSDEKKGELEGRRRIESNSLDWQVFKTNLFSISFLVR